MFVPSTARRILCSIATLILFSSSGFADDCVSGAPRCANANARALKLLQEFPSFSGMSDSARTAYCAAKIGAEVNSFCASEFRSQGRTQCAVDLERQALEYKNMASQNRKAMDETAARATDRACHWE